MRAINALDDSNNLIDFVFAGVLGRHRGFCDPPPPSRLTCDCFG